MKIVRLLSAGFLYFCVATALAVMTLLGVAWSKGLLARERVYSLAAALHGIPPPPRPVDEPKKGDAPKNEEQSGFEDVIQTRAKRSLDITLRETALDKGMAELRSLESEVKTQRRRYDELRDSFEKRLTELQSSATDTALQEVQRTIETIAPKQAKEQVLKMLDDDAMEQVVAIVKSMPLDKRKKLFAEFKTPQEAEKLAEILKQIRNGAGEGELIDKTRKGLEKFQ